MRLLGLLAFVLASVPVLAQPPPGARPLLTDGLAGWHTEQPPGSTTTLALGHTADDRPELRIEYALGGGPATTQQAAAVYGVAAGIGGFDRLLFEGEATRPMRISVQLRDGSDRVWRRSIYLDSTKRAVAVPFADFRPMPGTAAAAPDLTRVRGLLFVVDLTNNRPGDSGTIRLSGLQLER